MPESALALVDAGCRGALVALLLVIAGALWRERGRLAPAPIGIALALGLTVQVLTGAPVVDQGLTRGWLMLPVGISVANSVLFWLFACALFDDAFRWRYWHGLVWGAVAAVGAAGVRWCVPGIPDWPWPVSLLAWLKGWLPLLFALLALAVALRSWGEDLIEGRRRLRAFVVVAGAVDSIAMVIARLNVPSGRIGAFDAWLDVLMQLAIMAVLAFQLMRLADLGLFAPSRARILSPAGDVPVQSASAAASMRSSTAETVVQTPPIGRSPKGELDPPGDIASPDPADLQLAQALRREMTLARAYRDEGLSVATLAGRLRVPEYRMRRVINRQLGFRNFTAFVNDYRLAHAQAMLADPAHAATPVLTIALEAGFGSIGPFNRAFKARTGLTPSAFRAGGTASNPDTNLADS